MKKERLHYLFDKYFNQDASEPETEELMKLLEDAENDNDVKDLMQKAWESYGNKNELVFSKPISEHIWNEVRVRGKFAKKAPIFTLKRFAAAAILLIACGAGVYYFLNNQHKKESDNVAVKKHDDVAPGGNKAILTLGDGSSIVLDSASNGILAMQGSASVAKLKSGELSYKAQKGENVIYNALSTPRGGHYKVTLSDGSIVWLNATSSLRFPVSFTGNTREVKMNGEAYFEIAKNSKQPFIVTVNDGSKIEVLGTHFNVMAYSDESEAKTTLLEGAVKVNKGNASDILKPGQQASIAKDGNIKVKANVNTGEATSWKEEQFSFHSTDIYAVMKQIARWYDVDVTYKGKVSASLNGNIAMNVPLSQVLEILKLAGNVKFDIQGKKIIVSQE